MKWIVYMHIWFLLILLLLNVGCSDNHSASNTTSLHTFLGREASLPAVYRAKVPSEWIRRDPDATTNLNDTTQPICTFFIGDIKITIHNFPADSSEKRIPPSAQVERWKRQFAVLNPLESFSTPQAYAGYFGLQFEGTGVISEIPTTTLAWAMQMDPRHYSNLTAKQQYHPKEKGYLQQMAADYTIKAMGPPESMAEHRDAIVNFAHSFELIQEIPAS